LRRAVSIPETLDLAHLPISVASGIATLILAPFPSEYWRWFVGGMLSVFVPMVLILAWFGHRGYRKRKERNTPRGIIVIHF